MQNRFGESARITYHDTSRPEVMAQYPDEVRRIQGDGLVYPVTFIDGEPVYDGAVSYPAILRAVQSKLFATS
ncbi:MAG: hypothetical protein Q7J82_06765 [Coriobacteriia bacterium]|nr:hypothetical protein [Coriobacteriia bacterium]